MNAVSRVVSATALVVLVLVTLAHGESLRPLEATPDRLTWVRDPRGYEQALIVGDPEKSGLYAAHVRFPAGLRIAPHFHPDERIVTVLSGTVYFGYGERFDETRMRALPAGSVWTEPARQPHLAAESIVRLGEVHLAVGNVREGRNPVIAERRIHHGAMAAVHHLLVERPPDPHGDRAVDLAPALHRVDQPADVRGVHALKDPIPSTCARSSIAHSMAKVDCEDPYPRKPPPGIMFVYTAYPSALLLAHRYMVSGLPRAAASVSPPWPP